MAEPTVDIVVNDPRLVFHPESHTYRLGPILLPSVTQVLQSAGVSDFSGPWFTDAVKDRGTYVHQAIALDAEGVLDEETLDPQLAPYITGWRAFLAESGCEIEHWEQRVCDPLLGCAGTLDGILRHADWPPSRRLLVDVKRGFYASAGPQTAAYKRLALKLYDTPVLIERAVVELPGDGRYRLHRLDNRDDELVFLAALRIHNFRRTHGYRD
jgi:hypothetical protein